MFQFWISSFNRDSCYAVNFTTSAMTTFRHLWDGISPNLTYYIVIENYIDSILPLYIQQRMLQCYIFKMNIITVFMLEVIN